MKSKPFKNISNAVGVIVGAFKLNSIQTIITLSFTVITIFTMILVGGIIYNKFSENAENIASEGAQEIIYQLSVNMEYYLKGMTEVSDLIGDYVETRLILTEKELDNLFEVTLKYKKEIVTVGLFYNEGYSNVVRPRELLKKGVVIKNQDWFKNAIAEPETLYFSSPHVQNLFTAQHKWVVSLSRGVNFINNKKNIEGVLLVDMNFSGIEELCQRVSLGKRGYI